jgi:hypothetical protein
MRESQSLVSVPAIKPTLETVRHQFETWRRRRRHRSRIPEFLWEAAVGLCREHSICEVSRALRLNYRGLKSRVCGDRGRTPVAGRDSEFGFVRLDFGTSMPSSGCLIEMESPNGARMRMSLQGLARDFDPVELGRVFWRQGE